MHSNIANFCFDTGNDELSVPTEAQELSESRPIMSATLASAHSDLAFPATATTPFHIAGIGFVIRVVRVNIHEG